MVKSVSKFESLESSPYIVWRESDRRRRVVVEEAAPEGKERVTDEMEDSDSAVREKGGSSSSSRASRKTSSSSLLGFGVGDSILSRRRRKRIAEFLLKGKFDKKTNVEASVF